MTGRPQILDNPAVPAAVLVALGAALALVRFFHTVGHNASGFAVIGRTFAHRGGLPPGVVVHTGNGYDGQFYYRLALAPWDLARSAHGLTLDTSFRVARIGYPFLAWVVAGGQARLVPFSLVAVNVVALGVLGYAAGLWARSLGRPAIWGLLPAGYFGLVWSLDRDLTEITSVALVVLGLVAYRGGRTALCGLALGGAVLCRETAMVVVAGFFLARLVALMRRGATFGAEDAAWIIPVVAFAGWEAYARAASGSVPIVSEHSSITVPFDGVVRGIRSWFTQLRHHHTQLALNVVQLVALAAVAALAYRFLGDSAASEPERIAFVVATALVVCSSVTVWSTDPREFRTMTEAFVLGSGVLLGTRRARLLPVASATWVVWAAAAAYSVHTI